MNIQGVLSASDGDTANGGSLIIRNMYNLPLNNPYTLGATITDNAGTLVKAGIFGLNSTEEVYRKPWSSSDNKTVAVIIKSTSGSQPGFIIVFNQGTNISFNITISDCFIYDGQFKNPPITTSLDVKAGNQFALKTACLLDFAFRKSVSAGAGPKWVRLINISNIGRNLIKNYNKVLSMELLLEKQFTGSGWSPCSTKLFVMCYITDTYQLQATINGTQGIDAICNKTGPNVTNMFTKFRFANDSTQTSPNNYLEAYFAGSPTNLNFYIRILYMSVFDSTPNLNANAGVTSIWPTSYDGTNDTTLGSVYGYRFIGSNTYVDPS